MQAIPKINPTGLMGRFKALESLLRSLKGANGGSLPTNRAVGPLRAAVSIPALLHVSPFRRRIRVAELVASQDVSTMPWLPFLGQDGFLAPGLVTLMSGYAKSGKTTLIAHVVTDLLREGRRVLWVTEEPERVWIERGERHKNLHLADLELAFPGMRSQGGIVQELMADSAHWDVVIIDTIRTCLGIPDENDAQAVVRNVQPLIRLARDRGWALLPLHHLRKSGGEEGLAHAGSNALVALVDIAVELHRDSASPNRRKLKTVSRLDVPSELLVQLGGDGEMVVLGSPEQLALVQVVERIASVLAAGREMTVPRVVEALDNPKPSEGQVRRALDYLVVSGRALRVGSGTKGDPHRFASRDLKALESRSNA